MKIPLAAALALLALPATAAELRSAYTRDDIARDCTVIARSPPDEGSWSDVRCPGVGGYSYLIRDTDGRQSVTYGHAKKSGMATFGAFNFAHPTVEWRTIDRGGKAVPLAAIQRFSLSDADGKWTTQILVVSKVGQPRGDGACVMGYVSANEGAGANERARAISNAAGSFVCGESIPTVEPAIRQHVPRS